jgi:hypothetical protein
VRRAVRLPSAELQKPGVFFRLGLQDIRSWRIPPRRDRHGLLQPGRATPLGLRLRTRLRDEGKPPSMVPRCCRREHARFSAKPSSCSCCHHERALSRRRYHPLSPPGEMTHVVNALAPHAHILLSSDRQSGRAVRLPTLLVLLLVSLPELLSTPLLQAHSSLVWIAQTLQTDPLLIWSGSAVTCCRKTYNHKGNLLHHMFHQSVYILCFSALGWH